MNEQRFAELVARLERESRESPGSYKFKVALLAVLGFGVLLLVLLCAGVGILLIGGLAALVVFSGGKAILFVLKLGKLLILLVAPLWILLRTSVSALFTRFPRPTGREVTCTDAPALFAAIDDMRARMKGPRFHQVLITEDMNAAVVQRPLLGLFGLPRNYLILGLPLLESLSPEEALAVVAHEYGHLSGAHAHFGAFIYRLRNTWSAINVTASQWQGFGGLALRRVISWYAPFFNAYTFVLARSNEYQADAASAELVSPQVAAAALKRVNVASAQYQQFMQNVFASVPDSDAPPGDVAERWSESAIVRPLPALAATWLSESLNREPRAFDTHPVLRARIEALPGQAASVEELPPPLAATSAATAWLGAQATVLRTAQQSEWRDGVLHRWRERHKQVQEQRRRRVELRALAAPSVEETVERLRLQVSAEPGVDHLIEVSAFNAAMPGHAPTLYLEGTLRLDRDDDSGLDFLDRAMELEGEAVKPSCERAYEYLMRRRDKERAKRYGERWRQRDAWEDRRTAELRTLDAAHELVPAALTAEALASVRTNLEAHATGIKRAWIARRVVPADTGVLTYVIGVELTQWARFRSRGPQIVKSLAQLNWPMHLFVCSIDANKAISAKLRSVPDSEVFNAK